MSETGDCGGHSCFLGDLSPQVPGLAFHSLFSSTLLPLETARAFDGLGRGCCYLLTKLANCIVQTEVSASVPAMSFLIGTETDLLNV